MTISPLQPVANVQALLALGTFETADRKTLEALVAFALSERAGRIASDKNADRWRQRAIAYGWAPEKPWPGWEEPLLPSIPSVEAVDRACWALWILLPGTISSSIPEDFRDIAKKILAIGAAT